MPRWATIKILFVIYTIHNSHHFNYSNHTTKNQFQINLYLTVSHEKLFPDVLNLVLLSFNIRFIRILKYPYDNSFA